jgi:hypothetical protein
MASFAFQTPNISAWDQACFFAAFLATVAIALAGLPTAGGFSIVQSTPLTCKRKATGLLVTSLCLLLITGKCRQ